MALVAPIAVIIFGMMGLATVSVVGGIFIFIKTRNLDLNQALALEEKENLKKRAKIIGISITALIDLVVIGATIYAFLYTFEGIRGIGRF